MSTQTIDHATLEKLLDAGVIRGADVVGHPGGWGVVIKYGTIERTLAARRGTVRNFRRLETLVSYLRDVGIVSFNVNAANYDAESLEKKRTRPDASERMRGAFEAQSHENWLQEKVAESLADSRPNIPHDQVMQDVQAVIDAAQAKHAR